MLIKIHNAVCDPSLYGENCPERKGVDISELYLYLKLYKENCMDN